MTARAIAAALVMALTVVGCGRSGPAGSLPLRFERDIALPGDTSRFDYQDIPAGGASTSLTWAPAASRSSTSTPSP